MSVPISVTLPPDLAALIEEQMASGAYTDPGEVVRAGLLLLSSRTEEDREAKLAWLRKEIALGIESADRGELYPFDIEDLRAHARAQHGE